MPRKPPKLPGKARAGSSQSRRRIALGFADQILSSASNFMLVIAIARVSTIDEFGVFAVMFAALTTVLGIMRGCIGTPLSLSSSLESPSLNREASHAMALSAIVGALSAGSILVLGFALDNASLGLVVGASAIPLLLQDCQRFASSARGHPERALIWDFVWAVAAAGALCWSILIPSGTGSMLPLWIWSAGCGLSLLGLMVQNRDTVRFSGMFAWLKQTWAHRFRFTCEAVIAAAGPLIIAASALAIIGPGGSAALRGAGTVLGPLSVVISAVPLALIPEIVRRQMSPETVWSWLGRLAAALGTCALLISFTMYALPDSVGEMILGDSWSVAKPLVPFTGIEYAAFSYTACLLASLRALGRSRALLRTRMAFSSALTFGSVAAGLIWQDATAMAAGQAGIGLLFSVVLIVMARAPLPSGMKRVSTQMELRLSSA